MVILSFQSVDRLLSVTWMKAVEEQVLIPVVLFIMLYEAVLTFQSVAYSFKCDNLNESY